jgi:hypothetical protein
LYGKAVILLRGVVFFMMPLWPARFAERTRYDRKSIPLEESIRFYTEWGRHGKWKCSVFDQPATPSEIYLTDKSSLLTLADRTVLQKRKKRSFKCVTKWETI